MAGALVQSEKRKADPLHGPMSIVIWMEKLRPIGLYLLEQQTDQDLTEGTLCHGVDADCLDEHLEGTAGEVNGQSPWRHSTG